MNVRLSILFDYYGDLLTDKQKEFFEDYYFSNLTLQEIADNNNISRNAVHKGIKNVCNKLYEYEEILGLYDKSKKIKDIINLIDDKKIKDKLEELL